MLSAGLLKPLVSVGFRLPSSTSRPAKSHLIPTICSADITDGEDRSAAGAPKTVSGGSTLRGSDILIAMQRSVAHKELGESKAGGKKVSRKGKKRNNKGFKNGDEMENILPDDYDYAGVRQIQIRLDWGMRIVEIEQRIQHLRSRYHY